MEIEDIQPGRTEVEIIADLRSLVASPGFHLVLGFFSWQIGVIRYEKKVDEQSIREFMNKDLPIRSELSLLVGLWLQGELDTTDIKSEEVIRLSESATKLLEELHNCLALVFKRLPESGASENLFLRSEAMREAIFYSGDSAFHSQYKALGTKRYAQDTQWLQINKGFSIFDAAFLFNSIEALMNNKIVSALENNLKIELNATLIFSCFVLSSEEIENSVSFEAEKVWNIINSFCCGSPPTNQQFDDIDSFNMAYSKPIVKINESDYFIFSTYNLFESLYDSPFYWFAGDNSYFPTSNFNRGQFLD